MKKHLYLALLFAIIFLLTACDVGHNNETESPANSSVYSIYDIISTTETENSGIDIYGSIDGDWAVYQNSQELVERANLVLIGKVTGISFQMLDTRDSETIGDDIDDMYYNLYTLYDVDVITLYKGDAKKSIQVRVMGGLIDYQVDEQLEILALYNKQYIPILEENLEYKTGETYLFVLHQHMDFAPTPLNITQSSYNLYNPFAKYAIDSHTLDDSYYSKTVDDFDNPIISAKDVISVFGQDKWEVFWSQWQKDNPNWETWINKNAIDKTVTD